MAVDTAEVTLPAHPLGRLAESRREMGLLLIGLGIVGWLALMAVLSHDAKYWWEMPLFAVLFTVGWALIDRNGRTLIRRVEERSTRVTGKVVVRPHQGLRLLAITLVAVFGVASVGFTLASLQLGDASLTALFPGQLIGFGVAALIAAKGVGAWEREHDSEVMVATSWGPGPTYSYFVRHVTPTSNHEDWSLL